MAAGLLGTGLIIAGLVWVLLSQWERSLGAAAATLQAATASRAQDLVDHWLDRLRRVVSDVEHRRSVGVCRLDDVGAARDCLLGSIAADDALAEATFTSAAGWQASVYREAGRALPCSGETVRAASGWTRTRHCGGPAASASAPDPRTQTTYETLSNPRLGDRLIWSDLSYSMLDDELPEAKRRVVVHVLRAIRDGDQLVGVLRVALLEPQLDEAIARIRVHDDDEHDPFRVFLADDQGRLVTRFHARDRLREQGDEALRIAPADVPLEVAAALARGDDGPAVVTSDGMRYLVSFASLPDTQDWRVGVIGPEDYYLAAPRRVRQLVSVAAALLLCLVGMLLAFAAAAARRGLERVVAESERMRRFEFEPSTATSAFADIRAVLVDLERAKTALRGLARYAPVDLVRRLYADNREPKLGGELRLVTLLFTDVEGFTSFAETLPPERLAQLLGHYFAAMTAAVTATGGTVDKYIGDALMVLWNAPTACADHPARACRAALACLDAGRALFASPEWSGMPPLHTRFGIHSGEVMVGHFGAPERFSYTALGDGVNLAARLEALNKQYGTTILVSGAVAAAIGDEFALRRLDRVAVKGKSQGVEVFELLGYAADAPNVARARRYEAALDAYFARDFAAALAMLDAATDDPPSRHLRERCLLLRDDPPPPDWNGVHTATTK